MLFSFNALLKDSPAVASGRESRSGAAVGAVGLLVLSSFQPHAEEHPHTHALKLSGTATGFTAGHSYSLQRSQSSSALLLGLLLPRATLHTPPPPSVSLVKAGAASLII